MNKMCETENKSDIEEGEIKSDVLEDISECSLSEILNIQQDLKDDDSDIDQLREEALKSLSRDNEEITEEELYRLEALKSLLANIELSEKEVPEKSLHKKKRKRKKKTKEKDSKRKKSASFSVSDQSEELKLPSELPSKDVAKTDDLPSNENYKKLETRSWYPKTEFVLIDTSCPQNSKIGDNDCTKLIVNTNDSKKLIRDAIELRSKNEKIQNVKMPNNDCENRIYGDFINVPNDLRTPTTAIKPILCDNRPKFKHRVPVIATFPNDVKPTINPINESSQFRKVSKHHIRKFNSIVPVENNFALRNNMKNGKYKIVNASKYVLKKTSPKSKLVKRNSVQRYSINRVKLQYPRVNVNPKEFIIELDNNDKSKEEESKENVDAFVKAKKSFKSEKNSYSDQVEMNERILYPDIGVQITVNDALSSGAEDHKPNLEALKFKNHQIPSSTYEDKPGNKLISITKKNGKIHRTVTTTTPQQTNDHCNEKPLYIEDAKQLLPELHTNDLGIKIENVWSVENPCSCVRMEEELSNLKPNQRRKEESRLTNSKNEMKMSAKNTSDVQEVNSKKKDEIVPKNNLPVLAEAEAVLIQIRAKLFCNLGELEESVKTNATEKEKLKSLMKKMIELKSLIRKFEEKIKLQKSKLFINTSSMHSLFKGVATRTQSCRQLKDICERVGKEVIGPLYKPPDHYEHLIAEKRKAIDFSKYVTDLK